MAAPAFANWSPLGCPFERRESLSSSEQIDLCKTSNSECITVYNLATCYTVSEKLWITVYIDVGDGVCKCHTAAVRCEAACVQEIIAISCSWCKAAYHNKVSCFMMQQIEEPCLMGVHADVIIPPSWVIKLPQKVLLLLLLPQLSRICFMSCVNVL